MSLPVLEEPMVKTLPAVDESFMEELFPYEEPGDPNARAHYINPPMNLHIWTEGMETKEIVEIARVTGQEVVALCGYRWVPKHKPDNLDLCEKCSHIAQQMMSENGE